MGFLLFEGQMYLPCAIVIAGEEALAPPIKDVVLVPRGASSGGAGERLLLPRMQDLQTKLFTSFPDI